MPNTRRQDPELDTAYVTGFYIHLQVKRVSCYGISSKFCELLPFLWGIGVMWRLSTRKLHLLLRIERAEKDWFTTVQKIYFFGCLMNMFFGRSGINFFLGIGQHRGPKWDFFYILRCSECARPRTPKIFEVEFATGHKNPKDWRV